MSYNWFASVEPKSDGALGGTFDAFPTPGDYNWVSGISNPPDVPPSKFKQLFLPPSWPTVAGIIRCQIAINGPVPPAGTLPCEIFIAVDVGGVNYKTGKPRGAQNGNWSGIDTLIYRFCLPPFEAEIAFAPPITFDQTRQDILWFEFTSTCPCDWFNVELRT